jgi:beta-aspartyl-dipeptidase (metallo-type)
VGSGAPPIPAAYAVEERDLGGARLVPGLVDNQALICGGGGEAGFRTRVPAPALSRYTRGGITTVVGMRGTDDHVRTTGELIATARGLIEEGLSAYCLTGGYHLPPTTLTGSVKGDIVAIDLVVGVGELALSDHRSSQPTLEELLRVASEAHVAGLMTGKAGIVHCHMGDGERGLELLRGALDASELPPRVFNPTHCNRRARLFEEALALAARGCAIDVTAFPPPSDDVLDADELSAEDALERYLGSDLPRDLVTVSTDAGGCLPEFDEDGRVVRMGVGSAGALAVTLKNLLDRGRAIEDVLPAFTSNPARLLRLPHKGHLLAGADADLVVLDSMNRVRDTMTRGIWHVLGGEPVVRGTFE